MPAVYAGPQKNTRERTKTGREFFPWFSGFLPAKLLARAASTRQDLD
jgi:hypothetical protein